MAEFFNRDTKVYAVKSGSIWEIPVLEDYSFSQNTETTDVSLSEAATPAGVSRRGRRVFTDSFAPAEWSFSTYVRPFVSAGNGGVGDADDAANHHAVEEMLWAQFVGVGTYTASSVYAFTNLTSDATDLDIVMTGSNIVDLGSFDLYFVLGATGAANANYAEGSGVKIYKIEGCVVNEASIDFDVEGLATISWSGQGKLLSNQSTFDATGAITEGIASTTNYIRNKLTSLTVTADDATSYPGAGGGVYNLVITGGSISFNNNIEFLTPQTLGLINTPFSAISGSKAVNGNFTCYLDSGTNGDSSDLLQDLIADKNTITNSFALSFIIGGTGNTPRIEVTLPTAHLMVPTHDISDLISVDVQFEGIPSTISTADEATIKYVGA